MKPTASLATPRSSVTHDGPDLFRARALRVRLLIVVAIALSPLLLLSAVQAVLEYRDVTMARRDRLAAAALRAADRVDDVITGAQPLLEALRSQTPIATGAPACGGSLATALLGMAQYRNAKRFDPDGVIRCSALPLGGDVDDVREGGSWFEELRRGQNFAVSEVFYSRVSRGQVVLAAIPVRGLDGVFDGALGVSIDVAELDQFIDFNFLPPGASVAVVDGAGDVVSARQEFPYQGVPADLLAAALEDPAHLHLAADRLYPGRDMVIAPLVGDDVFVVITTPDPSLLSWAQVDLIGTVLLPLTMWFMALAAVAFASERLVLQWLEYLGRIARLYGAGRFDVEPVRAASAPSEIAELAGTMEEMAKNLKTREAELQESSDQKSALIKEVHHRVKNNLQIIVSLFNIQISNSHDAATIAALDEARARINALALVHRSLYEAEDLRFVPLRSFLNQLLEQLANGVGASQAHVSLETDIADINMTPEEAVPLALYVTEAVTNAFKHAFTENEGGVLRVRLRHDGGECARLDVEDDGVGLDASADAAEARASMGSALMSGFARQLAAKIDSGESSMGGARVTLEFPLKTTLASAGT